MYPAIFLSLSFKTGNKLKTLSIFLSMDSFAVKPPSLKFSLTVNSENIRLPSSTCAIPN